MSDYITKLRKMEEKAKAASPGAMINFLLKMEARLIALTLSTEGCRVVGNTVYVSSDLAGDMPDYIAELRDNHGYIIQTEIT